MSNNYYVYVYRDVREGRERTPIYVGMGKGQRAWSHWLKEAANQHFQNILNKIREASKAPEIVIMQDSLSFEQAENMEKALINWYGRASEKRGPLTNLSDGGRGVYGYRFTKEERVARSEQGREMWSRPEYRAKKTGNPSPFKGKKHTFEARANMLAASQSDENKARLRAMNFARKGKKLTEEHKDKLKEAAKHKKPRTPEHCKAISEALRKRYESKQQDGTANVNPPQSD